MNKQRRKSLQEIQTKLEDLKGELESLMNEEEEYRDGMPENLQGSERYERADEVCGMLTDAIDSIDNACSQIEEAAE